jgi:hypothetical protein
VHNITFTDSTLVCAIAGAFWSIFFVLLKKKWVQEDKHVITVHMAHRIKCHFAGNAVLFKDNVTWQVNLMSQFYTFTEWEF